MTQKYTAWQDLVGAGGYVEVYDDSGGIATFPDWKHNYIQARNQVGVIKNRGEINFGKGKFSCHVGQRFSPSWRPTTIVSIHSWVLPNNGDKFHVYANDGRYLGSWDGTKVTQKKRQRQSETSMTYEDLLEGAKNVFHPHTVRTKEGWKAQVVYAGESDYDDFDPSTAPIVWEGTTVHTDDTEGDNQQSGRDKARKQAKAAVSEAVEALFAKVKG